MVGFTMTRNRDWEKRRYHSDPAGQNYLRYLRRLRQRIRTKRQKIERLSGNDLHKRDA